VFYIGTRSLEDVSIKGIILAVCLASYCVSKVATASQQLWPFGRDDDLSGYQWIIRVTSGWNNPLRSVLVSFVITFHLTVIHSGSTTALSAISPQGGVSVQSSYFKTISCLI
ncbi:hypothetical protein DOTSEDRAFT_120327, partial [Dothistroma septosporum NZE10]